MEMVSTKSRSKLRLGWTGPCLVKWKISEVLYQIQKDPDSRKLVVHVDNLKPYSGENIPGSWKVDESVLAFPNSTFNEKDDASTDLNISDEEEYLLGEIETPEGHRVEEIIKDSINVTPPILTPYRINQRRHDMLVSCAKFNLLLNRKSASIYRYLMRVTLSNF